MKLVIDDLRDPAFDCLLARNATLGLKALNETSRLDELWLDHDLSHWGTIMPVVDWLLERAAWDDPYDVGTIFVHTMNPSAAKTMVSCLRKHYQVQRLFLPEYNHWIHETKPNVTLVSA